MQDIIVYIILGVGVLYALYLFVGMCRRFRDDTPSGCGGDCNCDAKSKEGGKKGGGCCGC